MVASAVGHSVSSLPTKWSVKRCAPASRLLLPSAMASTACLKVAMRLRKASLIIAAAKEDRRRASYLNHGYEEEEEEEKQPSEQEERLAPKHKPRNPNPVQEIQGTRELSHA